MSDIKISSPIFSQSVRPETEISDSCKTCRPRDIWDDWGIGWPGEPYDTYNPVETICRPHSTCDLRGWCHVANHSDLELKMHTTSSCRGYIGNSLLIIDGTAPDGTKLHLKTDWPLSRGGTDFTVNVVKTFDEKKQKEVYSLTAVWKNGWRDRYEERKRDRPGSGLPPIHLEENKTKFSSRKLKLIAQKG